MKIEGTDARSASLQAMNEVKSSFAQKAAQTGDTTETLFGRNGKVNLQHLSQMTEFDKNDLPISDRVVIEAIERANDAISIANKKFEYSIHEKTNEIMVKVIDTETNEVIREIPPKKILDMVAKMWEMAGLLVDERR